jgi:hypothetical protein
MNSVDKFFAQYEQKFGKKYPYPSEFQYCNKLKAKEKYPRMKKSKRQCVSGTLGHWQIVFALYDAVTSKGFMRRFIEDKEKLEETKNEIY